MRWHQVNDKIEARKVAMMNQPSTSDLIKCLLDALPMPAPIQDGINQMNANCLKSKSVSSVHHFT